MSVLRTTVTWAALAASVSAHGYVSGFVAGGTYYTGYSPSFQYQNPPPTVAGWSDPENLSNGYVAPSAYTSPDIVCHLAATPGGTSVTVAAGDVFEIQWTTWPDSHKGPVMDYLAPVDGDFAAIDKTTLKFFKIDEAGLIDGSAAPGKWASDELIANNNSWAVTIPTSIAPGKYVLRHEIIALHSAGDTNGAQNYPQCINLDITSDGTDTPAGEPATSFYKEDDPGIKINIYTALSTYAIPGPALYTGAASPPSQTTVPITSEALVSTSSPASTTSATPAPPYSNHTTISISSAFPTTPSTTPPVSTTETAYNTLVPTSAPAYSPTAAPTFYSSSLPTSTVAPSATSAAPSSTAAYSATTSATPPAAPTSPGAWGQQPEKALPEGWTLTDLQQWVSYLLQVGWNRTHARDFRRREG